MSTRVRLSYVSSENPAAIVKNQITTTSGK